jgi:hypothetical protein
MKDHAASIFKSCGSNPRSDSFAQQLSAHETTGVTGQTRDWMRHIGGPCGIDLLDIGNVGYGRR